MTRNCTRFVGRQGAATCCRGRWGAVPVWVAAVLALLLLVGTGIAYRAAASGIKGVLDEPIDLPVPLSELPLEIHGWVGEESPIATTTKGYMETNFADDYISRHYVNSAKNLWADAYVVYCASKPAGILGHQPRVCFPAHGWIHDGTTKSQVDLRSGERTECLLHQFHKPAPAYREVFVLSFWVLNGQITLSEDEFSGVFGRRPNISGDPARYVAQVQISSTLEYSARAAARDLIETTLTFLPDKDGQVRAAHGGQ
jgi:hypothetical protein